MGIGADFKKFLLSGNLVSMAVAFVVGLAVVGLITALVDDVIDPLVTAAAGGHAAPNINFVINGATVQMTAFLSEIGTFLILMLVVFLLIAEPYQIHQNRVAKKAAAHPTTRACPYCANTIPIQATKCGFCTSAVPPAPAPDAAKS